MRRAVLLFVLLAALAAFPGRGEDPPVVEVAKPTADAVARALPSMVDAQTAFAAKDWDAAIAAYTKALAALGDDAALGGWRDQANYNIACAEARAGRAPAAAAAFAKSVESGLRSFVQRGPDGNWRESAGLTLEHVLADADLDPIRKEPLYVAALKPYLAAGEPVLEFTRPDTNSLVPALILLAGDGEEAERVLPAWRVAAKDANARVALVAVAGPVRAKPDERRWTLGDGDERWAVAKLKETLDLVAADVHVDKTRIFLVGVGERPGEAAWAAAMSESARLAGFAAPGARFHAAWHADAIAKLPATWRVVLGAPDEKAAKLLKDRGIEAARLEPSNDGAKLAAEILKALLGL